jgi:hypothetical protein
VKHRLLILADATSGHTSKWIEGLSQSEMFEIHLLSMNPYPTSFRLKNSIRLRLGPSDQMEGTMDTSGISRKFAGWCAKSNLI